MSLDLTVFFWINIEKHRLSGSDLRSGREVAFPETAVIRSKLAHYQRLRSIAE